MPTTPNPVLSFSGFVISFRRFVECRKPLWVGLHSEVSLEAPDGQYRRLRGYIVRAYNNLYTLPVDNYCLNKTHKAQALV